MTDRRNDDRDGLNPTLASTPPTQHEVEVQDMQLQGVIELREERLIVHKEREVAGSVALTREVRRETVQVPVELVTEGESPLFACFHPDPSAAAKCAMTWPGVSVESR